MPPTAAVGWVWTRRSSGCTTQPARRARSRTSGVAINVTPAATPPTITYAAKSGIRTRLGAPVAQHRATVPRTDCAAADYDTPRQRNAKTSPVRRPKAAGGAVRRRADENRLTERSETPPKAAQSVRRELGAQRGHLVADGCQLGVVGPVAQGPGDEPGDLAISGSRIPWVVVLALPIRTPLVTKGLRGSSGMVLRLRVMPARSSTSWACLPVRSASNVRRSTSMQVVVGAARHEPEALAPEARRPARRRW